MLILSSLLCSLAFARVLIRQCSLKPPQGSLIYEIELLWCLRAVKKSKTHNTKTKGTSNVEIKHIFLRVTQTRYTICNYRPSQTRDGGPYQKDILFEYHRVIFGGGSKFVVSCLTEAESWMAAFSALRPKITCKNYFTGVLSIRQLLNELARCTVHLHQLMCET